MRYSIPRVRIQMLLLTVSLSFTSAPEITNAQDFTILPLGNSITQSRYFSPSLFLSYRYYLWYSLLDDGRDVDFVGSLTDNFGGNPTWPPHSSGALFDQDHEGHWGLRADQLADFLPDKLMLYSPDVALIHAGSNDVFQGNGTSVVIDRTIEDLKRIIRTLRLANPTVTVFLAQIIPCDPSLATGSDPYPYANLLLLNAAIPSIATDLADPDSPIIIVDQFTGFDPALHLQTDKVHPNEAGEQLMASVWKTAMDASGLWSNPRHVWEGNTSSDWSDGSNWKNGTVPASASQVVIPPNAANWPVYGGNLTVGTQCGNILMDGTSQLTIAGNLVIPSGKRIKCEQDAVIIVEGDYSNDGLYITGTGNLELAGTAAGDLNPHPISHGGKISQSAGNGGYINTNYYLEFDCVNSFFLKSVYVDSNTGGPVRIYWANSAGVEQEAVDVVLPSGESRVTLDFLVTPGGNQRFGVVFSGTTRLWRDLLSSANLSYPYPLGECGMIYGVLGNVTNNYYYLYDFEFTRYFNNVILSKSDAQVNTTGDINIGGDLTLLPGAWLTNGTGQDLLVGGDFEMQAGNNAISSFINNGSLNVQGATRVEQYLSPDAWHYVSPLIDNGLSGIFTGVYLYEWDEPNYDWFNIVPTTTPLSPMKGYAVWNDATPLTALYSGSFNHGPYSVILTNQHDGSLGDAGFNLAGNPFPSSLDWDAAAGWTKTDIDDVVYLWSGVGDGLGGTYHVWIGPAGTDPGVGIGATSGVIPPGQGFLVKASFANGPAATGSLSVDNAARVHGSQAFYKTSGSGEVPLVRLNIEDKAGREDETVLRFIQGTTPEHDGQYDAHKLFGHLHPQLYSLTPSNVGLAISTLPEYQDGTAIPLALAVPEEGIYSVGLKEFVNFEESIALYLEDMKTGESHNISDMLIYSFFASPVDDPGRFMLVFKDNASTEEENLAPGIYAFAFDGNIVINLPDAAHGASIVVFDLLGRKVFEEVAVEQKMKTIPIKGSEGYYMVQVAAGNAFYSQKVFVR